MIKTKPRNFSNISLNNLTLLNNSDSIYPNTIYSHRKLQFNLKNMLKLFFKKFNIISKTTFFKFFKFDLYEEI